MFAVERRNKRQSKILDNGFMVRTLYCRYDRKSNLENNFIVDYFLNRQKYSFVGSRNMLG